MTKRSDGMRKSRRITKFSNRLAHDISQPKLASLNLPKGLTYQPSVGKDHESMGRSEERNEDGEDDTSHVDFGLRGM